MKGKVSNLIRSEIDQTRFFLVELKIDDRLNNINVYIDGDDGISIDDCAEISRLIASKIEEQDLIDHAHNIQVSSPGVSKPLKHIRQFKQNVNRKLKIRLKEQEEITGKLIFVDHEKIGLETGPKDHDFLLFTEIDEAKVLI